MSGPACVLVEDLPQRPGIPEAILDRLEYRLEAGKTSPIRVNAVLRTNACETKPISRQRQKGAHPVPAYLWLGQEPRPRSRAPKRDPLAFGVLLCPRTPEICRFGPIACSEDPVARWPSSAASRNDGVQGTPRPSANVRGDSASAQDDPHSVPCCWCKAENLGVWGRAPRGIEVRKSRMSQKKARTDAVASGVVAGTDGTNKPNLPTRTEMGAGPRRHQRSRRSGPLRQTNPICPASAGKGAGRWGRSTAPTPGAIAPNKANPPRAGGTGEDPSQPRRGQNAPNKANPAGAKGKASTSWKKSYDALDTRKASAKQDASAKSRLHAACLRSRPRGNG